MPTSATRSAFIRNALEFAEKISRQKGVQRIAIVREITKPIREPEILCLLVTIDEEAPIKPIADIGRKLKGRMVSMPNAAGACGGCISMIGVLTGFAGEVPTTELFQKNARIAGITVGSRRHQQDLVAAVEANDLQPVIDSSYPLVELAAAFRHQESQRHFGKICVSF